MRHAAGRKALQNQVLTLLRDVVQIVNGKPMMPLPSILILAQRINLTTENVGGSINLDDKSFGKFIFLAMMAPRMPLNAAGLEAALGTDLLLEYEPATGAFKGTPAYDLLTELLDQVRKYDQARANFKLNEIIMRGIPANRLSDKSVNIPAHLVAGQMQLFYRWADIAGLAKALAVALDGKAVVPPSRMPLSPFVDQEEELKREMVSLSQVREFAGLDKP